MKIVNYRPQLQCYFERFNKAWLEEKFTVEPIDKYVLENPEEAILKDGGKIIFVEHEGAIIGTVALRRLNDGCFELTKMAVDKAYRGLGAGSFLCKAAIDEAKEMGAITLVLYSQSELPVALSIYRKLGFIDVPVEPGVYKRADVMMKMEFTATT
jgi:GNAT superfamily N-acetyltransferase